jgi:hypothetical protein
MRHLLSAILLLTCTTAHAGYLATVSHEPSHEYVDGHILLKADYGGNIHSYAETFQLFEDIGSEVWVKSVCLSACTMVLRNPNACALPNALFGFHAARRYDKVTLEIIGESDRGNRIVWSHYPAHVKARLGGRLSPDFVYIKGTELLPPCKPQRM